MNHLIPDVYSYITTRKEKSGGFCFNPYLLNEITLNQKEMRIAELCNGEYTVDEIEAIIAKEYQIDQNQIAKIVDTALKRLNRYYAINWKDEKKKHCANVDKSESETITSVNNQLGSSSDYYSAPLSVIFELTYKCNLACQHCLVDAGRAKPDELSFVEIAGILEQLKEMKVFTINFGGGEPLLRPDFFEIMEYASDLNLGIVFSTNGYLVNESVLEKLADIKTFSLQISVDGLESTHDDFRGVRGSYKRAIWALKEFSDKGYHTTMSTMMLKTNLGELESLIKLCVTLGVSSFKLSTFMPAGRGKVNIDKYLITRSDLKQVAEQMQNEKKKYGNGFYIDNKATFPWLFERKAKLSKTNSRSINIGCSAARTNIVISPTGEVYPCPFLHEFPAGNLREKKLKDIWDNSEAFCTFRQLTSDQLKGKCYSCEYLPYQCQGGCRAAAFLKTGDFFAEDPFCWHQAS